jgi:hypothetical protein
LHHETPGFAVWHCGTKDCSKGVREVRELVVPRGTPVKQISHVRFHLFVCFVSKLPDLIFLSRDIHQRILSQGRVFMGVGFVARVRDTVEVSQQYHHGIYIIFLELDFF